MNYKNYVNQTTTALNIQDILTFKQNKLQDIHHCTFFKKLTQTFNDNSSTDQINQQNTIFKQSQLSSNFPRFIPRYTFVKTSAALSSLLTKDPAHKP